MKTVTRDDKSPNIYTIPVKKCNLQTFVDESKYEEIHHNKIIFPGGYILKKEPSNISGKIQFTCTLLLVHLPYSTNKAIIIHVLYHSWNHHCIIWVMNTSLNISSSVCKDLFWKYIIKVRCTSSVIFLWDTTDKKQKRVNYRIEEWHTSTPYDILWNESTYPNVCLLPYMWHRTDHCITVCGKWIFVSNLKVALPLTQVCLKYICCGNDTDENKLIGVLHAIRSVPPEVVQRRLNMK